MTEALFRKFQERFPPINGFQRISIYEAYERIYLDLIELPFLRASEFNSQEKINNLASKIFDVHFESRLIDNGGWRRHSIIFEPIILPKSNGGTIELMEYSDSYSGHSIEITLPASHPQLTISTGNRGKIELLDVQREKYYSFVEGIYQLFLENAKNP